MNKIVGLAVGATPVGAGVGMAFSISKVIVFAIVVILLIIALAVFPKSIVGGVWTLGAAIAVGTAYYMVGGVCSDTAEVLGGYDGPIDGQG